MTSDEAPQSNCSSVAPADAVLIRHSDAEYDRAVRDLAHQVGLSVDAERQRALSQARLWLALRDNGHLLGFALSWVLVDELEVVDIGVSPEARREGIGRRLLGALLNEGEEEGCTRAFLEVRASNAPAQALYRAHGFEQVGRRTAYYRDAEDALLFSCCLGTKL